MLALAAASAAVLVTSTHPGYGGGTCVDVTFKGTVIADTLCPSTDDLAVRTLSRGATTIYYGDAGSRGRVRLTFRHRTVRVPVADRGWAVATRGLGALGAVAVHGGARDLDVFGLPARRATIRRLRDEANRRVRIVAAAPRTLTASGGRRATLCTGIQLAAAVSPGRQLCQAQPNLFQVRFSADCKHDRQLVYGIAPRTIARATAVLTNGDTAPVTVTRTPKAVKRPGVVLTARLTGNALATKVRGYDASGKLLASASLGAGCT